jgi:hypothetical protein
VFATPGQYQLTALAQADADNVAGTSPPVAVTVA